MNPITRRSVMAGSAAAVAAVPALGVVTHLGADPLLAGIRLHLKMIEAINVLPDDVDGDVTEADEVLEKALAYPVISAAGAFAVLDVTVDEPELFTNSWLSELLQARAKEARDFLAGEMLS